MDSKITEHPYDCYYYANDKGISLVVETHFGISKSEQDSPPLKTYDKFSRFVWVVSDKNEATGKKCTTANLAIGDTGSFLMRSDYALKKCMDAECSSVLETNSKSSPAYSVRMMTGVFKNQTPAQILANKDNQEKLRGHYEWLKENLQKYPANKAQMDAIRDAFNLCKEGKLEQKNALNISGQFIVHDSHTKPLIRREGRNGKSFVYELHVKCNIGNKYPFEVTVDNYYAPVVKTEKGTINVKKSESEDMRTRTARLSADDYAELIRCMKMNMSQFETICSAKVFADADKTFSYLSKQSKNATA